MACNQNLDLRCLLISDPSTLGAGVKTHLESRIKKFTPYCICRPLAPTKSTGGTRMSPEHDDLLQRISRLSESMSSASSSTLVCCHCNLSFLTSLPCFFKTACKQNLDLRCVLISDPSTQGAGAKTRLKPRIKKFTPHCCHCMVLPPKFSTCVPRFAALCPVLLHCFLEIWAI